MKTRIACLISFAVLLAGCDKKKMLPAAPPAEEPVFFAKCEIDGQLIEVNAGSEGYFMKSTYYQDSTSCYVLRSELEPRGCGSCGYTFAFLLQEPSVAGTELNIEQIARPGLRRLSEGIVKSQDTKVCFIHVKSPGIQNTWTVFDGKKASIKQSPTFSCNLQPGTTYTINLKSEDKTGQCVSSHDNVFKMGNPLQVNIAAQRLPVPYELGYKFIPNCTGKAPYQYRWDLGDGTVSYAPNPEHEYNQGDYVVRLRTIDANNDTCYSAYQVAAYYYARCEANFNASFQPIISTKLPFTGAMELIDPSGLKFSTLGLAQPESSYIEIVDVNDYKHNEAGQPTKILTVRFSCLLANGDKTRTVSNGEAKIAVAYK